MEFQPIASQKETSTSVNRALVDTPIVKLDTRDLSSIASSSKQMTVSLLQTSYLQMFQSLNMGFSLAVALAWNDVVKEFIVRNISVKKGKYYQLMYASVVTLLAGLVFMLTKMFVDKNIKRAQVTPVLI